ncbi:MAG: DUF3307 domain-containing protein [Erysipelotrichaceae bacterium]|jgi:hypothetical protein|nr:DUF3307 domain-containing protein [Erysipelotrichaceae bacterium]
MNSVLCLILLAHLLGDFTFQNDYLARRKDENWIMLYIHFGFYALGFFLPFLFWNFVRSWLFIILAAGFHAAIDAIKLALIKKYGMKWKRRHQTVIFVLDQILHLVSLYLLYVLFGGDSLKLRTSLYFLPDTVLRLLLLLVGYLKVGSLTTLILLKGLQPSHIKNDKWLGYSERAICLLPIWGTNMYLWLVLVAYIIYLFWYYRKDQSRLRYQLAVTAVSLVFIMLWYYISVGAII